MKLVWTKNGQENTVEIVSKDDMTEITNQFKLAGIKYTVIGAEEVEEVPVVEEPDFDMPEDIPPVRRRRSERNAVAVQTPAPKPEPNPAHTPVQDGNKYLVAFVTFMDAKPDVYSYMTPVRLEVGQKMLTETYGKEVLVVGYQWMTIEDIKSEIAAINKKKSTNYTKLGWLKENK